MSDDQEIIPYNDPRRELQEQPRKAQLAIHAPPGASPAERALVRLLAKQQGKTGAKITDAEFYDVSKQAPAQAAGEIIVRVKHEYQPAPAQAADELTHAQRMEAMREKHRHREILMTYFSDYWGFWLFAALLMAPFGLWFR